MANIGNINASRPQIQGTALDQATKLAGDSTNAKVVISKAMEVLAGANLSVTKADSSGATGAAERKTTGAYVQLHFDDRRKSCECPRRYVKLVCDPATKEVTVEMLSRVGRAVVDGKTLSAAGDKAVLPESGILNLPPTGYRLKLVRASAEASELRGDDDKPVGQMKRTFRR